MSSDLIPAPIRKFATCLSDTELYAFLEAVRSRVLTRSLQYDIKELIEERHEN